MNKYPDQKSRWQAVIKNEKAADGSFYYAVITTGIYCRPSCTSKTPKQANVIFFDDIAGAVAAGYRACKRCKPDTTLKTPHQAAMVEACRMIREAEEEPSLVALAAAANLSPGHFQRLFKAQIGLTPKQYAKANRKQQLRQQLQKAESVTSALYEAGYNSSSRAYADQAANGLAPKAYRKGGAGQVIHYAITPSSLGPVLVAVTAKGVCMVEFGAEKQVLATLERHFPKAELHIADGESAQLIGAVVRLIDHPAEGQQDLPLDIRGTAFQEQVWQALTKIKPGETLSYSDLAQRLGKPKGARAVARAVATNTIAVLVPCHRVIGKGGTLNGYKWGLDRKAKLLEMESIK